ncbi:MAG: glutamate 5-kinase [Candidatus Schekmanbacteria bacterium]|nr:glutamate 5-kinase [Candidatus Schekmanbacteria bacterium]
MTEHPVNERTDQRRRDCLCGVRRIVVKVGSQVLSRDGSLDEEVFGALAVQIAALRQRGYVVAVVSSGAVASGRFLLGLTERPRSIPLKQAAAAAGQPALMHRYHCCFAAHGLRVAQVLLTSDDLHNRRRFLNARRTMNTLFELGIVPIINENDTVAVEEIKLGDNDRLSSLVTNLVEAELLVILTDVDGFFDADPREHPAATRYSFIEQLTEEHLGRATTTRGDLGLGGMITKLEAARQAAQSGASTIVARGVVANVLLRLLAGEDLGTFIAAAADIGARKHWIAYTARSCGELVVDAGAVTALVDRGKSLLPSGVVAVLGDCGVGDPVRVLGPDGAEVARGLVCYGASDLRRIAGRRTSEIASVLGAKFYDEVIHRNDLVVTIDHRQTDSQQE